MKAHGPKSSRSHGKQTEKKAYLSPTLKKYGSIHLATQATGPGGGDGGMSMMVPSDRMIKRNIVRIGTHPTGIGLYLFDYKADFCNEFGQGRQLGVMADEVETVMPAAVTVHSNGYRQVDYRMLGIIKAIH